MQQDTDLKNKKINMALVLYSNGIIEEYRPSKLTFTEEELLSLFGTFKLVKSKRLMEIPNTWCVWGESENADPIEFNRLCTDIIESHIFSHVIFIHDSELNPSWELNDMIYKSYEKFKEDLHTFIDAMAQKIMEENDQMHAQKGTTNNMIYLTTAGQTDDKHVIYMFNPTEQSEDFYKDGSFSNFSERIVEYFKSNLKINEQLTIFADKKIIINVEKDNVPNLFSKMIKNFELKEDYEICEELTHIYKDWTSFVSKKKRGRPKKNTQDTNK